MTYRRLTVTFDDTVAEALTQLAQREHRDPKRQVSWLVVKAATEAGLLPEMKSGDGANALASTTVTRVTQPAAA